MKYVIAIIVSFCMWFVADLIFDNHLQFGASGWWREMWVMFIGIVTLYILNEC